MGIFSSIFKSYSEKQIKKIIPVVDEIEALAPKFEAMSDEQLRKYTDKLKGDLADGSTLDDILPEAFALVREADTRVLGKRPFRVQLMGGILLHQGRIAEMRTGEGKTLVATLPAYLNALTGKGVHVVTVNDYLATRDSEEMGKVYGFLGLSTGLIVHGQDNAEKQTAYAADITYGTNNEFGFDYLRDNMTVYKERLTQRGHNFAIVDEVDSILIDEARTPLIISGNSSKSTELYTKASALVRGMTRHVVKEMDTKKDYDYYEDHFFIYEDIKAAAFTEKSLNQAKLMLGLNKEDFALDPELQTYGITEGAKLALIENEGFSEGDFSADGDIILFSLAGASAAEARLNRTFNKSADANKIFFSYSGARKLVKFFGFEEQGFATAGSDCDFGLNEKGRAAAEAEFGFGDRDFREDEDSGVYALTSQGAARIDKALNFDYIVDEIKERRL